MRAAAPAPAEVANGGGAEAAEEQPAKRVCRARACAEQSTPAPLSVPDATQTGCHHMKAA